MAKKSTSEVNKSWNFPLIGLLGVAAAGSVIAYYVPSLPYVSGGIFSRLSAADSHQLIALIFLAAITVIYLAYFRAKFFFSARWLVAAVAYNFLILFVKFTLSARELAGQTFVSFGATLTTALLISLLYLAVFGILYLFFDGRLLNRSLHQALIVSAEGKALLSSGLFVAATLLRVVVFSLPVVASTEASNYLSVIFKTNNVLLSALLFIMIVSAVEAFAQVRRRADLKYFFVSGMGLLLTFHLWWAIFIFRGH